MQFYKDMFENSLASVCTTDRHGNFYRANSSMWKLFGYSIDKTRTLDSRAFWVDIEQRDDWIAHLDKGKDIINEIVQLYKMNGAKIWVILSTTTVKRQNKTLYLNTLQEVTKNKELSEQNQKLVFSLGTRIKTINCLNGFFKVSENSLDSLDVLCTGILPIIKEAWQFSEIAEVLIEILGKRYSTTTLDPKGARFFKEIKVSGKPIGKITVCYTEKKPISFNGPFLEEEIVLLGEIAARIGKATEHIDQKNALEYERAQNLMRLESELGVHSNQLEIEINAKEKYIYELNNKTITLRTILCELEAEKNKIRENVAINVEMNIKPLVGKVRAQNENNKLLCDYLDTALNEINSDFYRQAENLNRKLSKSEIRIAHLVKSGYTSKEIAERLSISYGTVKNHLYNIRKKIGLSKSRKSLKSYFSSAEKGTL